MPYDNTIRQYTLFKLYFFYIYFISLVPVYRVPSAAVEAAINITQDDNQTIVDSFNI